MRIFCNDGLLHDGLLDADIILNTNCMKIHLELEFGARQSRYTCSDIHSKNTFLANLF
jgi:hypothetical protein